MEDRAPEKIRIIACGAIAREIIALLALNELDHIELTCLPAILHNYPEKIPGEVEREILEAQDDGFSKIYIAYADCGTGGHLDKVCEKYGVERIAGPHCYSFFIGNSEFQAEGDDNMQSFFLTDFLARQFDAFITKPLGLDRHPELRDMYFGNYRKLVYLAQTENPDLDKRARAAADALGLEYERRQTGYGDLSAVISELAETG
ncbi:MAG: DUF1638 domain-containing protein [Rhizobiaceae bacterium]